MQQARHGTRQFAFLRGPLLCFPRSLDVKPRVSFAFFTFSPLPLVIVVSTPPLPSPPHPPMLKVRLQNWIWIGYYIGYGVGTTLHLERVGIRVVSGRVAQRMQASKERVPPPVFAFSFVFQELEKRVEDLKARTNQVKKQVSAAQCSMSCVMNRRLGAAARIAAVQYQGNGRDGASTQADCFCVPFRMNSRKYTHQCTCGCRAHSRFFVCRYCCRSFFRCGC